MVLLVVMDETEDKWIPFIPDIGKQKEIFKIQ